MLSTDHVSHWPEFCWKSNTASLGVSVSVAGLLMVLSSFVHDYSVAAIASASITDAAPSR
ncbi:MAG: hypothetical protein IJ614_04445 [Prevotella sp.]|nr:hypothetical protein [Prevotella sp.]